MTDENQGRSLELYFVDGRADGMLTAEMFGWTGHILVAPRTQLKAALGRKEASYTGVYILLGEQEGMPLAYIGEAEDVATRIRTHDAKKDWWTKAVLITSAANSLNKAHARYLESRLISHAAETGQTPLANGAIPSLPGISEAATANLEAFLANVLMVLPALRIDMFVSREGPAQLSAGGAADFELISRKHGLMATAVLLEGEFVVRAGSTARMDWEGIGSEKSSYALLHAQLRQSGVLAQTGEVCVFTTNYSFASPSAAASVVYGRPSNGTNAWRVVGSSMRYKEWEETQLNHL